MADTNDISAMIAKIMQNPEFSEIVSGLRGDGDSEQKNSGGVPDEVLGKIPDIVKMLSADAGSAAPALPEAAVKEADDIKNLSSLSDKLKNFDKARAAKLMLALKPYLSHERGEIIDKCMSVMNISDIFETVKGLENLIK